MPESPAAVSWVPAEEELIGRIVWQSDDGRWCLLRCAPHVVPPTGGRLIVLDSELEPIAVIEGASHAEGAFLPARIQAGKVEIDALLVAPGAELTAWGDTQLSTASP